VLKIIAEISGVQVVQIGEKPRATERAHRKMRKRVAEGLNPEMGRLGAADPAMTSSTAP